MLIDEHERDAYIRNDRASLTMLRVAEENAEDYVSPEHEAMIDDRNRLRDSLQTCVERMDDAIAQLDALNTRDEPIGDSELIEFAPAFHDAISNAETALEQCDEQIDDTLAEKLAKMTRDRDALAAKLAQLDTDGTKWRQLRDAVRHVVSPWRHCAYIGDYKPDPRHKPAPKWAAYLIATLTRLEKP